MQQLIDQLKERAEQIALDTGCDTSVIPRIHAAYGEPFHVSFTVCIHGEAGIYAATEETLDAAERRARDEMATGENIDARAAQMEKQAAELSAKAAEIRKNAQSTNPPTV
jgi:hypothetical protein